MKKVESRFNQLIVHILGLCALLAVAGGIGMAYLFFYEIKKTHPNYWEDVEVLGVMGEFLGGTVGSIWALAGVILFFLALIYQKRELSMQREELKESRKIMENQSTTIAIQQFENTFFQLLNFHINGSKNIRNTTTANGKLMNGFDTLFNAFKKEVKTVKSRRKNMGGNKIAPDDETFEMCFNTVYEGYKNTFQHYLENYRTLVTLITNKSHDPEFYFNILKSHFTEQEVLVQFYYIILFAKDEKLTNIAEKFGLFQKLNLRAIGEIDAYHLEKLNKNAYVKDVA